MDQFKDILNTINGLDLSNATPEQVERVNLIKQSLIKLTENKPLATVSDFFKDLTAKAQSQTGMPIVFTHNSMEYTINTDDIKVEDGKVKVSVI